MIRVALLSKWHVHAVDYANQAKEIEDISIELVWDENAQRGEEWGKELGVPFEADLENVLSNPSIDGVIITTPTVDHKYIMIEAAKHGKHIFTEKVLALTVEDCDAILSEVEKAEVELMISLPRLVENYYLYAQKAVDQGWLGQLTMIRCRVAHNGAVATNENPEGWLPQHFYEQEKTGGGALIDLGAHSIYLANRLAGTPHAVMARLQSVFHPGIDDQAAAFVEYESGVLGVLETSFVSSGSPFQLEVYGTEGTILIEQNTVRIKSAQFESDQWMYPEDLPDPLPMPMKQWVKAIQEGHEPTITKEDALKLTLVNQGAVKSQEYGQRIDLTQLKQ
ncbi:dehydrogenase [Halobacillus andaensis]|uniref:Dehydrogenase n=1 Tax=Halobacillus andaensis TaxID=1176239 RepID=A0A917BDJ7_HALAA|nr:Gfo/Idh/MocA family oxidoreductase [Halobacillus andaensis]MBP2006374.1 putative dehydrogenase [Halobacillus andaensis]GGF34668.1 dehydrogenase [Halobacillus andaensis]